GQNGIKPTGDAAHIGHDQAARTAIGDGAVRDHAGDLVIDHGRLKEKPGNQEQKGRNRGEQCDGLAIITRKGMELRTILSRKRQGTPPAKNNAKYRKHRHDKGYDAYAHLVHLPKRWNAGGAIIAPPERLVVLVQRTHRGTVLDS